MKKIMLFVIGIVVLVSLAGFGLAHVGEENETGHHGMMEGMMGGVYGYGFMWLFGWIFMILVFVILVLLIIWLITEIRSKSKKK